MPKKDKSGDFFWVSYSDLMTSLFFIMLVLYVLTFVLLKIQQGKLQADAAELAKIREIQEAVEHIDPELFNYDTIYRKHILNIQVKFASTDTNLYVNSPSVLAKLEEAGKRILNFVDELNAYRHEQGETEVKYLVIIEGQASRDAFPYNDELSYRRALSLLRFWQEKHIDMENHKDIELILAGSGTGGVPRAKPDRPPNNQRFLIHVIPKVGEI